MTESLYEWVWILYFGAVEPVSVLPEVAAQAIAANLAVEVKQPTKPVTRH
jgi:hypothetical protein